jgi:predicted O-methyltransferase YrrM
MYSRLRLVQKYLHYYFTASNGKGHGIHSPFVFDFVRNVLNDRSDHPAFPSIETLRQRLLKDQTFLDIEDMGAGGAPPGHSDGANSDRGLVNRGLVNRGMVIRRRTIADIARHAAKTRKLGQLFFRIARHYRPHTMLELGTSLGLSSAYLASGAISSTGAHKETGNAGAKLLTIEGASSVAAVAAANFRSLGLENIALLTGHFDDLLPGTLDGLGSLDLVFVDGNHRREPTWRYFNMLIDRASRSSVLIFDDIHWSREMEEAWAAIRADPRSILTIDLFSLGLVFLRDEFKVKQDFVIRFAQ